jgi:hypothetical protein
MSQQDENSDDEATNYDSGRACNEVAELCMTSGDPPLHRFQRSCIAHQQQANPSDLAELSGSKSEGQCCAEVGNQVLCVA